MSASKAAARKLAFARRKSAHSPAASARACANLLRCLEGISGKVISGYVPIRTEVDIMPAMTDLSRRNTMAVPVVLAPGKPLVFHWWRPGQLMTDGTFGTRVPARSEPVTPRIVVLPMLAFDSTGVRLGYGGGFYDRTLAAMRAAGLITAIGFAYAAQEVAELPATATDELLDAVVTDTEIRWFRVDAG